MEKLKATLACLLTFALLLCCGGCFGQKVPYDYRATAFCVELRWTCRGQAVGAVAEYGAPLENGRLRDMSVRFSEPEALCGLHLGRTDGTLFAEYLGLVCDPSAFQELFAYAELLISPGEMCGVCQTELYGLSVDYAEIRNGNTPASVVGLWLRPESGIPQQLSADGKTVTVLSFEKQTSTKETESNS